ncbi:unnamed protein product [Natator depressus]
MTRKHGVQCLLVPASPHVETYVQALARMVGPSAIVAASKMYGKVIIFLALEAAAQEVVERGLAVGGLFVPLEPLEDLGICLVLTSVPPFLPSAALLPALSTLGKSVSVISSLPLGCKDPNLRHIFSFRRQVQLLLPSAARDGEALEGSFLVPHQGALYRVYFSTGEARCYLCRASGHVRRDCPLARQGGAPGIPETRQDIGPVIADAPGRPIPEPAPPPLRTTTSPAQAQGAPPLQCPDERESPALAADNLAGPMEEGVAEIPPGMGESLLQGESSLPYAAPPSPPQAPEPSPLPPDTTPANQPPDDAMEGWALVQGKRGKRKARAAPHLPEVEAPWKTRKGGTDAEPSTLPTSASHPPVSAGKDVVAPEGSVSPPRETLPSETLEEAPSVLTLPKAPVKPEATIVAGASGENPGATESVLSSKFEEIEALNLTPVAQGEDDLLPANLNLGDLTPPLFSPCSLPLTAVSAPTSEEPLDSSTDPAADGTPLTTTEPAQVTAGAMRLGHELPGAPPIGAEQSISFLGGGPTEDNPPPDAVAAKSTIEPAPGITESSLPTHLTLEPDREAPPSSCLPPETQNLASARAPAPTPIQSTSCNVIAAPGAVSFPFPTDDPQGAAFVFSCPNPLGAAIFPPPSPIAPGFEAGLEAPAHQAPCGGPHPACPF